MYQLAIVPATESMTPELAETMALIKTNMTEGSGSVARGARGARYFTMRERDSSSRRISLAGEVPVASKSSKSSDPEASKSSQPSDPEAPEAPEASEEPVEPARKRSRCGREATAADEDMA